VHLTKDVEELIVYLVGKDERGNEIRYSVEWKEKLTPQNEAGWHEFDYDAGVDYGADPPPDGSYPVVMRAQDAVGQWTTATGTLTIENGGVPRAYILNGEVDWSGATVPKVTVPLNGTLYFTLTIENDSRVPIRTSGPPSGTVYDSDENYATLGQHVQSGVFRVGVHCENNITDHPWRWAIGGAEDLVADDEGHLYLPAERRATVPCSRRRGAPLSPGGTACDGHGRHPLRGRRGGPQPAILLCLANPRGRGDLAGQLPGGPGVPDDRGAVTLSPHSLRDVCPNYVVRIRACCFEERGIYYRRAFWPIPAQFRKTVSFYVLNRTGRWYI
jgi:hypothetical protein